MNVFVMTYDRRVTSARDLARALEGTRVILGRRDFPVGDDLVINWGCSDWPEAWRDKIARGWSDHGEVLNHPHLVRNAVNKLTTFNILKEHGVEVPQFTTDINTAREWLSEGKCVIGRERLSGSGGDGIVVYDSPDGEILPAPLYTLYRPKRAEFRVHIFRGEIIDVQRKARRTGQTPLDSRIRSYGNGWVFCREGIVTPSCVNEMAQKAVSALGLDFGAVDVGWTESGNIATVYEVNTAPRITETTLTNYINAFKEYLSRE